MSERNNLYIFVIISFLLVIFTNQNFTLEENMLNGAVDGNDYLAISKLKAEFINLEVENHRVWRFLFPYSIGAISRITTIEIPTVYKIFNFFFAFLGIFFFVKIIEKNQHNIKAKILFFSLLIFNMYTYRYFLTLTLLVNDFIFMNAGIIIAYAFIYKKKYLIYVGLILSLLTRQNGIIILVSFYSIKIFFRSKSYLTARDLLYLSLISLMIYLMNTTYANQISDYNNAYSFNDRFGILNFDYSLVAFIKFISAPLLVIFPLALIFIFYKKKYTGNIFKNEINIYLIIVFTFLVGIAISAGPNITGRNILRFIGILYPLILIFLSLIITDIKIGTNKLIVTVLSLIILSLHPTYSQIQIFSSLQNYLSILIP